MMEFELIQESGTHDATGVRGPDPLRPIDTHDAVDLSGFKWRFEPFNVARRNGESEQASISKEAPNTGGTHDAALAVTHDAGEKSLKFNLSGGSYALA